MTAHEIFERMAAVQHLSKLEDLHAVCVFDIENVGSWTVTVDNGRVAIGAGRAQAPDVELSCSEPDLLELVSGPRAAALIMQGRVVVQGDFQRLLRLRPLFLASSGHAAADASAPGAHP